MCSQGAQDAILDISNRNPFYISDLAAENGGVSAQHQKETLTLLRIGSYTPSIPEPIWNELIAPRGWHASAFLKLTWTAGNCVSMACDSSSPTSRSKSWRCCWQGPARSFLARNFVNS